MCWLLLLSLARMRLSWWWCLHRERERFHSAKEMEEKALRFSSWNTVPELTAHSWGINHHHPRCPLSMSPHKVRLAIANIPT